ncbi:MAG: TPM domain-containing protein [Flavobacteriales bacterium]
MKKTALAAFLWLVFLTLLPGQTAIPPLGRTHIIDQAGILDPSTESMLEATIQQEEDSTSNQIVVLTLSTLGDETIEEYSVRAFEQYALGQKDKDNGVLIVFALNEKKVRIEVGHGLEGALPDARCGNIIQKDMIPSFREGNYEQGIVNGVHSIISAIHGEYTADADNSFHFRTWHLVVIILLVVILLSVVLPKSGSGRGGGGTWYSGGYYGGWGGSSWGGGGGGWSGGGGGWSGGGGGSSGGGGASGGW